MKRALVTGASEGIGRQFAIQLAELGYSITAVARNEERLEELVAALPGENFYITADLSTVSGAKRVAQELTETHYELLVNNAGVGVVGPFAETSIRRLQSMMKLNIDTLVMLSHAYLNVAQEGDALINVSSALAFLPMPLMSVYAATKAFVTSFSESLWQEQQAKGVFVMALHPGVTETNFHDRSGGDESNKPPKAMSQTPDVVVKAALQGLERRCNPTIISGIKNKLFASMGRFMPRKQLVTIMGKGMG